MRDALSGEDKHNRMKFHLAIFRICQNRYGSPHYYATLFSVDDLIPVYSGGKFGRYSNQPTYSRPTSNWHHLLNGLCAVRVLVTTCWWLIELNKLLAIRHLLSIIDRQDFVERTLINQFRNCPTKRHPSTEIWRASAPPTTKHVTIGRWAFWPEDLARVKPGYFKIVADWRGLSWKQRGDQDWPRPPRPERHHESKRNGDEG